jgi:hypothetical protein
MKNIAIKVIDRLFIVVYGTANPTDQEWEEYLTLVQRHGVEQTVQLISTEGGEPTSTQRRRLNALLGGRMVPVAVVSDQPRIRRTVSSAGLKDALAHLEIPKSRAELIEGEIRALRAQLGQTRRATA